MSVFVTRLLSLKFNPPSRFSQFLPITLRQLGEDKETDSEREGDSDRCSGRQRVLRGKKKEVTRWMMVFFFFFFALSQKSVNAQECDATAAVTSKYLPGFLL